MKKTVLFFTMAFIIAITSFAQTKYQDGLKSAITALDNAKAVKEYQKLAGDFEKLAGDANADWLAPYYAAYCNARIGWIYHNEGDRIEPFINKAEQQIQTALSYIDSNTQKKEVAEIYAVMSMIHRSRVYINTMTYGPEFGPKATQCTQRSAKADPGNPRAGWLDGWEKYATPKMFGGDKVKAKEILLLAKAKLEQEKPAPNYPHWGKSDVDALLKELK